MVGAVWCSPVCWHGDHWWRWRAGQQEQDWSVDSGVEHWGEFICSPQKYMCKAISPHLKWLWVLYKEWNFRPINVCMGPQMTAGQTGGEQKGPPISSVYLLTHARARNTELQVLCCLNLSSVPQSSILCFISCQGKEQTVLFKLNQSTWSMALKSVIFWTQDTSHHIPIYHSISTNFTNNLGVNVRDSRPNWAK